MLSRKIAIGGLILSLTQLTIRCLDIVFLAVVARFLTPEDFGLVALAAGVMLVLNSLSELPVSDVLVQRERLEPADLAAAFTLTMIRGILIAAALFCLAGPMAGIYDDPRLIAILHLLAVVPLVQGTASPAMVRYTREVNYRPAAIMQIAGKLTSFCVAVTLAVLSGSYWALVLGMVAAPVAVVTLGWVFAPWRPRLQLAGTRSILAFAGWVTVSRMLWTLSQYSDRFFIGGILGKTRLGHYTLASDMSSMATYALAGPLTGTLFAGFSRIRNEPERLRLAYLRGQQVVTAAILPLGVGLAVLARPLVEVVLTPAWEEVIPVIALLAPMIALQSMAIGVQSAALALARPRTLVLREAIALALATPATILAAWWFGLTGAAAARCFAGTCLTLMNLYIARLLLGVGIGRQLANCRRSLISVAVMAAGVSLIREALSGQAPLASLLAGILSGMVLYIGCHFLLWRLDGRPEGAETFVLGMLRRRQA